MRKDSARAFTRVDLLVIISVLAILALLFLPAMQKAKAVV